MIRLPRLHFASLCGALAWLALPVHAVQAQDTIRLLVGFAPGGSVDTAARGLAEAWHEATGDAIVVENRPGAGGRLAIDGVLREPADGHTVILMPSESVTLFPHVYHDLPFDPMADLVPVAPVADYTFALAAGPAVAADTLDGYLNWARSEQGGTAYATPGAGTAMHFAGFLLGEAAGIDAVHTPYRGGALALNDVLGGHVPVLWSALPAAVGPHRDGRLRLLAHTGAQRLDSLPDVPTFAELGFPQLQLRESFSVFARAGTADADLDALRQAVTTALTSSTLSALLEKLEMMPASMSPDEFAAQLQRGYESWGETVSNSGYTPQN